MIINPNHRKKLNIVWGVVVVLIIASMIIFSLPSLFR